MCRLLFSQFCQVTRSSLTFNSGQIWTVEGLSPERLHETWSLSMWYTHTHTHTHTHTRHTHTHTPHTHTHTHTPHTHTHTHNHTYMVLKYFPQHRVLKHTQWYTSFPYYHRQSSTLTQETELKVTVLLCFDIYVSMKHGRWETKDYPRSWPS